MCITAITGGNLQPLYERLRGIEENALHNFVAIFSTMVLALPMALLQMSVALGDVHHNVTNSTYDAGEGEEGEVESFSSTALAMWALAFAAASWEKDQLKWWDAKEVGVLSGYFVLLCLFRLLEVTARVTLVALFAAIFGATATAALLVGGIALAHMAKYLTSHFRRLVGRDAPLQSTERWVTHAMIESNFLRENEPEMMEIKLKKWHELVSLNRFSASTATLLESLPIKVKETVAQGYASKYQGDVALGTASQVAKVQKLPDSQKSEELLDYELSRPRLPDEDRQRIELACSPPMIELHLRGVTPLEANVYLVNSFADGNGTRFWCEEPEKVKLVPGLTGIVGLLLTYFMYLDLPIADPFKYNVNPLFLFTARALEAAVVIPLVLREASAKLVPLAIIGSAAFAAHLLVFPPLFYYARRFHMYARPDTDDERYQQLLGKKPKASDEESLLEHNQSRSDDPTKSDESGAQEH